MNTPLNIAICEDNLEDMTLLLDCINDSGIPAKCDTFSSGEALLASFVAGRYDVIFLDIYMKGIKGIDAAAKIRATDTTVMLCFTTTSLDHTLESYRLKAPKYMEKPVTRPEVLEALKMALDKRQSAAYITLLIESRDQHIPVDSILYFEQHNHAVMVNTLSGRLRTSQKVNLSKIESLLSDTFLRCHHSFIVNLKYVRGIDKELKTFTMQNGDKVYIRHSSLKNAAQAYENYLFNTARGV